MCMPCGCAALPDGAPMRLVVNLVAVPQGELYIIDVSQAVDLDHPKVVGGCWRWLGAVGCGWVRLVSGPIVGLNWRVEVQVLPEAGQPPHTPHTASVPESHCPPEQTDPPSCLLSRIPPAFLLLPSGA